MSLEKTYGAVTRLQKFKSLISNYRHLKNDNCQKYCDDKNIFFVVLTITCSFGQKTHVIIFWNFSYYPGGNPIKEVKTLKKDLISIKLPNCVFTSS